MSNVGSNEKNSSNINITDVDFLFADTDWQALFVSVISLHEAVELYWHKLNTLNGVTWNICRGYILQFKINVKQCLSISIGKKKIYQYNSTASWKLITEMWCQPYPIIAVLLISIFIQNDGCDSNIFILLHFYTIVTRLNFFQYFPHLTYSQCWMAELSLRTFDHRDMSEYHYFTLLFVT
jgi:hypothetical protein